MSPNRAVGRSVAGGFTLIEILVALTVLAVVSIGLLEVFSTGLTAAHSNRERVLATLHAQSLLASIGVERPLEPGQTEGQFNERYRWKIRVKVPDQVATRQPSYGGDLYDVTILVSWGAFSPTDSLELRSFRWAQAEEE